MIIHKDGVTENTHPLNLAEVPDDLAAALDHVMRPPLFEVYMRMAEELAKRSTCARLQVGTVLTDASLEQVLAIGYNGNVRGFPNRCDSDEVGRCGCIHSEMNALVKSPGDLTSAFISEWMQPQRPASSESQRLGKPRTLPL